MLDDLQELLKRMWTPPQAVGNAPFLMIVRVRWIYILIAVPALVLLSAVFLFHVPRLLAVSLVGIGMSMTLNAIMQAFRIRWVMNIGRWNQRRREPIQRHAQPARYWTFVAINAAICAVYAGGGFWMIWFGTSTLVR
jgi:hypothetical protein